MKTPTELLKAFKQLSVTDQSDLLQSLRVEFEGKGKLLEVVKEEGRSMKRSCPHCQGSKIHKRGMQNNVQMYRCVSCEKWFSSTTGTPLWDIKKKDKWQGYLDCMRQGMPIKKIAKEIGISIQTSFDWRHKILSVLNEQAPVLLQGRVECDELELSISNKGERNLTRAPRKRSNDFKRNSVEQEVTTVQVITAVDQDNNKYFKVVEAKRITAAHLTNALGNKLDKKVTLITDKHPSYRPFVKSNPGIKHRTIKADEHVGKTNKKINLQRVNNTHKQLREFLGKFNGVSTKYLANYLNWFAYGKNMEKAANQLKQWFITILSSQVAYELYQSIKLNAVNIRT